jgi:predicted metal-dependent enzyme (double-stranded beta helix superfamily)
MFNKDKFIQDCIDAVPGGQPAMREVVAEAVSDGAGIVAELGEPEHAGINPLYRSAELTILNFAWAPCMSLMPHNHQMYAVIGIYSGREDNVFWRRTDVGIEAAGAKSLGNGDVATLGRNIIHSVLNPLNRTSQEASGITRRWQNNRGISTGSGRCFRKQKQGLMPRKPEFTCLCDRF